MEVERKDRVTGEINICDEHFYVSRNACLNQEGTNRPNEMIEINWWSKFPHLIKNDKNTGYTDAVDWCKENSKGLVHTNSLMGLFGFELEEDALQFRMVWG